MGSKKCPKCGEVKPVSEYHSYFSKSRQKLRIGNYCKPCSRSVSLVNATKNYRKNRAKKLAYAKKYRKENYEKIKSERPKYKKRQIEELQDCYVRELLVSKNKVQKSLISEKPEILNTKRLQIKIKRKIKQLKNGTEQIDRPQRPPIRAAGKTER